MRDDLGVWPPSQAEALVRVLSDHGIDAETEPSDGSGGEQVRVTVPSADATTAANVMAARMDEIAAAAAVTRKERATRWFEDEDDEGGPPLMMERFRRMGTVLVVLVAGLMIAIMIPGPLRIVAALGTFAVLAVLVIRGRRSDDRDDQEYGPGA